MFLLNVLSQRWPLLPLCVPDAAAGCCSRLVQYERRVGATVRCARHTAGRGGREATRRLVRCVTALYFYSQTLRPQKHRFVLSSLLCTAADVLSGRLFCVDWRAGTTRTVRLRERRAAQCCSRITALADYSSFCHGAFSCSRIASHHLNTHTTGALIAKCFS